MENMLYTCAGCTVHGCESGNLDAIPKNCPIREPERMAEIIEKYGDYTDFFAACARVEAEGYCQWPRLRETVELCKKMGFKRLGLAFCGGLKSEAKTVETVLRRHGFEVCSLMCKTGGIDKSLMGLPDDHKVRGGGYEPMCNPIAQAEFMNDSGTDFNIALGLCVGHDSLFLRHSRALSTVLVAKDRVTGHNPCAAIYTAETYSKSKL